MESKYSYPPAPFQDFQFNFNTPGVEGSGHTQPFPPSQIEPSNLGFDFDFGSTTNDGKSHPFTMNSGSMAPQPPLLSPSEHTNLLGFLDAFEWDFNPTLPHGMPTFNTPGVGNVAAANHAGSSSKSGLDAVSGLGLHGLDSGGQELAASLTAHLSAPATASRRDSISQSGSSSSTPAQIAIQPAASQEDETSSARPAKRRRSSPSLTDGPNLAGSSNSLDKSAAARKPLLTQPQKRLNHIMSEQRRRNAIKDGYATIERLIAPAPEYTGPLPTLSGTTEDKSGGQATKSRRSKGKGRGKGKMGTLFRAVEYCNFLEESVVALKLECERLEMAAKITVAPPMPPGLGDPNMVHQFMGMAAHGPSSFENLMKYTLGIDP